MPMNVRRSRRCRALAVACLSPWWGVLVAQANGWQKVAEYGWYDVADAPRPLSAHERALGGGAFASVNGVAEGRDGSVWVLDLQDRKLAVFAPDGRLARLLGGEGEGPGEFRRPIGLTSDADGAMYVWDRALSRLTKFGDTGGVLATTIVKASGLFDVAIAGDTAWFVRPMIRPIHAVLGVSLRSGEVADSFALLTARDVQIAGFGSPGKVVTLFNGEPVYVGPRPVQLRVRGSGVQGTDRFPSAQGLQLERGARVSPVAIRAADANANGEIVVLYSSVSITKEGMQGDQRYFLEVVDSSGRPIARTELSVEAAGAVAWTRDRHVLVGVVDEVPRVWKLRLP